MPTQREIRRRDFLWLLPHLCEGFKVEVGERCAQTWLMNSTSELGRLPESLPLQPCLFFQGFTEVPGNSAVFAVSSTPGDLCTGAGESSLSCVFLLKPWLSVLRGLLRVTPPPRCLPKHGLCCVIPLSSPSLLGKGYLSFR